MSSSRRRTRASSSGSRLLAPGFIDFSFPARRFPGGDDPDFFVVFIARHPQGVNHHEDHDTDYEPDGQPSFLKFIIVRKAEGARVVKNERSALKADAVFGKVPGVLSLVPSKRIQTMSIQLCMYAKSWSSKRCFGDANNYREITLVLDIKSFILLQDSTDLTQITSASWMRDRARKERGRGRAEAWRYVEI